MNDHTLTLQEFYVHVDSGPQGLTRVEAEKRRAQYGKNELLAKQKKSIGKLILHQFQDVMILILIVAAAISFFIGDIQDGVVILIILFLNAIIGFFQEYKAEKAIEALKNMATPVAKVKRDNIDLNIPAVDLVPGDLVLLEAGMIVPADIRLLKAFSLQIEEASLTGESVPVEKSIVELSEVFLPLGDRSNMAYKSTRVISGRGEGLVSRIGMQTQIGRIATLLQEHEGATPLQRRMSEFAKKISLAVVFICLMLYGVGWWRGEDSMQMLLTAISVAVAAIPEALPAVITIALALGANRMVRKNALIRKLSAVETLGSVNYICADKTGTITQNKMQVTDTWIADTTDIVAGLSKEQLLCLAMAWNHDVTKDELNQLKGDPTEIALVEYCRKREKGLLKKLRTTKRQFELPFDSVRKRMTTIHPVASAWIIITKGAVESISEICGDFPEQQVEQKSHDLAMEGKRLLAYAIKKVETLPETIRVETIERDLQFLGLVALVDPPRPEARQAIADCLAAGITPIMITGDHKDTAMYIAKETGIYGNPSDTILTGKELEFMPAEEFENAIDNIKIYARVSPEQKVKIVKTLQKKNNYVAMTGDGVNDALALKSADIGIAMGIHGTDVSKEAAHMILLDENFATIIKAVKEGRRIFDNIQKFIKYILTGNSGEIWTIVFAMVSGFPIPLQPIQILWVNLVSDSLPALGFTSEKAEDNIMKRLPRKPDAGIFSGGMAAHILWVGFLMGLVCFGAQVFLLDSGIEHWQTMVFTILSISQIGHAMAIRSDRKSIFVIGVFGNRPMLVAVLITLMLQISVLYIPFLQSLFHTHALSWKELFWCIGFSSIVFWAVELEKLIRNLLLYKQKN